MDKTVPAHDQTTLQRKPWIGDVIAAYEKKFNEDGEHQVSRRLVLIASLIVVLCFGWSLLPLAGVSIWMWISDNPLVPYVAISIAILWSLRSYIVFKAWWKDYYEIDEENAVSRADAPALFQLIDEVSQKLGDGKVDKVIISEGHGAWAVFGRHRRWYGGGRERHIKLGLLTLFSVSAHDLRPTLAHEAHHLFGDSQYGVAFGAFAFHLAWNARWSTLYIPVRLPIRILERHLRALMYVRSKHCEIAADAFEIEACEPRDCAISLMRFYATGEEYHAAGPQTHPGFWLQEERVIKNEDKWYGGYIQKLYQERSTLQRRMKKQLNEIVAIDDIHPSLRNRITSALGPQSDQQLEELVIVASETIDEKAMLLLGDSLQRVVDALNKQQWEGWKSYWKAFNEDQVRMQQRLVPAKEVKTLQHAKDHYNTLAATSGVAVALPWLDKALLISPEDTRAKYLLSRFNLEHDDPQMQTRAVQSLHELAGGSSLIAAEGSLKDLSRYYRTTGDHKRLEEVGRLQSQLEARQHKLHYEKQPTLFGKYSPVALDGSVSFEKCVKLEKWDRVVSAIYVAHKYLSQCDETRYFVFALRFNPFRKFTEKSRQKVIESYMKQIGSDMKIQRAEFNVVDRSTLVGLKVRWYGTRLDTWNLP